MDDLWYQMIFKRKSFHIFKDRQTISDIELRNIEENIKNFKSLDEGIKTAFQIVPAGKTSCKRGEEYCILLYSEKKGNYLRNIGYIGEQLDLYLASLNIGALWFGIGKTDAGNYNGLDFVIMIAIARVEESKFRKDMFKSKRKPLEQIWEGNCYQEIGNIVRFAPSACNTQPWKVVAEENKLTVYRYKQPGKRGIMPAAKVAYYNRIDMGIFLLFLELCLAHEGLRFERALFADADDDSAEMTLAAVYLIG